MRLMSLESGGGGEEGREQKFNVKIILLQETQKIMKCGVFQHLVLSWFAHTNLVSWAFLTSLCFERFSSYQVKLSRREPFHTNWEISTLSVFLPFKHSHSLSLFISFSLFPPLSTLPPPPHTITTTQVSPMVPGAAEFLKVLCSSEASLPEYLQLPKVTATLPSIGASSPVISWKSVIFPKTRVLCEVSKPVLPKDVKCRLTVGEVCRSRSPRWCNMMYM